MTEPLLNDRFLGVENRSIVALNDLRVRFMFSDEQLFNYIKDIPETITDLKCEEPVFDIELGERVK